MDLCPAGAVRGMFSLRSIGSFTLGVADRCLIKRYAKRMFQITIETKERAQPAVALEKR